MNTNYSQHEVKNDEKPKIGEKKILKESDIYSTKPHTNNIH